MTRPAFDFDTAEGCRAYEAWLADRRATLAAKRPSRCNGSNRTVAAPATNLGFTEACSHCEAQLVPIIRYGEWQIPSHRPLGKWKGTF